MKPLIRYFFKILHAIVGPVLLALDQITTPGSRQRSPADQREVDRQTKNLVMYQFLTCPFCIRTRRTIRRLALNIEMRDALWHAPSRQELLEGGGQIKVPCLRITDDQGNYEWMYESSDIIRYLQENFTPR